MTNLSLGATTSTASSEELGSLSCSFISDASATHTADACLHTVVSMVLQTASDHRSAGTWQLSQSLTHDSFTKWTQYLRSWQTNQRVFAYNYKKKIPLGYGSAAESPSSSPSSYASSTPTTWPALCQKGFQPILFNNLRNGKVETIKPWDDSWVFSS